MSGTIEEFDDDTDFALPNAPSAGGSVPGPDQMAQLQQMMAQMGGSGGGGGAAGDAGGFPPGLSSMMGSQGGSGGGPTLPTNPELSTEEKKWISIYPIYFDAKRPYKKGGRRIKYEEGCLWPKSENLADAAQRLTLLHAHEPRKQHPQDWENPGRIKVRLFDDDGEAVHSRIQSKNMLLKALAEIIQPHCGGKPPALVTKSTKPRTKGREAERKAKDAKAATRSALVRSSEKLQPHSRLRGSNPPPMAQRYPVSSPAREAGILNTDFGNMLGGMEGMGPLGAMMGQMGLGGDDEEDDEEETKRLEEEKKKKDPLQQLSRKQRKRVIRVSGR